jgi:hypothetical protein
MLKSSVIHPAGGLLPHGNRMPLSLAQYQLGFEAERAKLARTFVGKV